MIANELHLDEATTKQLVSEIGEMFSGLYNQLETNEEPRLGESFAIWKLDIEGLSTAFADGKLSATPTPFQHHQIWLGDRAKAYALSDTLPSGKRQVVRTSVSIVAERMHDAIRFLDHDPNNQKTDLIARLLSLPEASIYTFWLLTQAEEKTENIYLFSAPDRFAQLQEPRYFKPEDFLSFLDVALSPFRAHSDSKTLLW